MHVANTEWPLELTSSLQSERLSGMSRASTVLLLITFLSVSPGLLGSLSGEANAILLAVGTIQFLLIGSRGIKIRDLISSPVIWTGALIGYLVTQSLVLGTLESTRSRNYLIASVAGMMAGTLCGLCICSSKHVLQMMRAFVVLIQVLVASQLITYPLLLVFSVDDLTLHQLTLLQHTALEGLTGDPVAPLILFPFTIVYGITRITFLGIDIPRSLGIFREPGVYAMYLLLAYIFIDLAKISTKRVRRFLKLHTAVGLILTGSTAGFVLLVFVQFYRVILNAKGPRRRLAAAAMMLFSTGLVWFVGEEELERKAIRYYNTDESRISSIQDSARLLMDRPLLGYGGTTLGVMKKNEGINLLSALHFFGLIGLFLYGGLLISTSRNNHSTRTRVVFFVVAATVLISQPLYYMAFVFFVFHIHWDRLAPSPYQIERRAIDVSSEYAAC